MKNVASFPAGTFRKIPTISTPSEICSGASLIASAPPEDQAAFLADLPGDVLRALPYLFEFWALPHQLAPEGDWRTWMVLGGRGAGKTRAGAEWVRAQVEGATAKAPGLSTRVALVGETFDQARDVMVFGESGILACSPMDRKPVWEAARRRLVWPNGAVTQVFSAHDFEGLRGPQFDAAWIDELAKWPHAEEAWDMLQFALRLGDQPRQVVTTPPRAVPILQRLLEVTSTVMTHAPTWANRANLAESFLDEVGARYGGTRLGRQELEGILLEEVEGALWTGPVLKGCIGEVPEAFDRIVVAGDPPVTGSKASDDCGIVVVGAVTDGPPQDWRAVVIEDASVSAASPLEWAHAAVAAFHRHGADRLVAEVNQGGDLVETVLRQIDGVVPYRGVHASRGKAARAEPVAALYEQGRVAHVPGLGDLEDQMGQMTTRGFAGKGSPDRVDALVWALTDLILEPAAVWRSPRVRSLG